MFDLTCFVENDGFFFFTEREREREKRGKGGCVGRGGGGRDGWSVKCLKKCY